MSLPSPAMYLSIDDGGAGEPAFLFVHSLGGTADFWNEVTTALRPRHRAIAFDLRGHGESARDARGRYTLDDFADDVLRAADAGGVPRFVLVGHSFGALVALAAAARAPARVEGLVLIDAAGALSDVPAAALEEFLARVGAEDGAAFVRETYVGNLGRATPATRERVLGALATTDPKAILGGYTALFASNSPELLARYPGPVRLIVDAANDSPMSLHAQQRELDLVAVEGTSHWVGLDRPDAVVDAIRQRPEST